MCGLSLGYIAINQIDENTRLRTHIERLQELLNEQGKLLDQCVDNK